MLRRTIFGKNGADVRRYDEGAFHRCHKLDESRRAFIREDKRNGGEFAKHKLISKKLKIPVFFTAPYSSWQKGTVENTNKLIRQYIPKSMNIKYLSYNQLLVIQNILNYRPRKVLFFNFPANIFYNFAS